MTGPGPPATEPLDGQQQPAHPATTRRGQGVTADGEFYMPTRVLFGRGVRRPGRGRARPASECTGCCWSPTRVCRPPG